MRRGDLILSTPELPRVQLYISDLDSNEPLFELFDYSLNIVTALTDTNEPFNQFQENYKSFYGELPSFFDWVSYDGMYHFAHGLSDTI